jgi:hypothetical protein
MPPKAGAGVTTGAAGWATAGRGAWLGVPYGVVTDAIGRPSGGVNACEDGDGVPREGICGGAAGVTIFACEEDTD